MPNTVVIDLSHYNLVPESLQPARNAGVWGCIHKASEGTSMRDSKLEARAHLARDAGMLFGSYHFLRPGKIRQQADYYVETIQPVLDEHHLVACDYEVAGISLHDVDDWMDRVELKTGRSCVLYTGFALKEAITASMANAAGAVDLQDRRLWIAQYAARPVLPKGWKKWWLWQWTDKGTVPGITPPTDCNDYQGSSFEQLEQEWSGRGTAVLPPSKPVVRVIAPPGVEVIVEEG